MAEQPEKSLLSRVWIVSFFIMGVIIGLLLLVLEREAVPVAAKQAPSKEEPAPKPRAANIDKQQKRQKPPPPAPAPRKIVAPPEAVATPAPQATVEQLQPLQCDREQADAVMQRAQTLSSFVERGGGLQLNLTSEWEYYSPGHRRSFVEVISEADRCLQGRYRPLQLNYRGEEVARVGTDGAIEMK